MLAGTMLMKAPTTSQQKVYAPIHGWFTEGFDTRDFKEAKALLEGLT